MKSLITKLLKKQKPQQKSEPTERRVVWKKSEREIQAPGFIRQNNMQQSDQQQEEEILNSLIKMSDHLKITKINRSLQGEYLTLCHINRILCEQIIHVRQIKQFLRNKSGETVQFQKETFFQTNGKTTNQLVNYKNAMQYYTHYSNGLIFQFYSVRALLWKISLGYLLASKNKWISMMEGNLLQYHQYIKEHIVEIVVKKRLRKQSPLSGSQKQLESEQKKITNDHPLNSLKDSKWKTFFDDKDLWNIIQKDTIRTKPNCKFFQQQFEIQLGNDTILQKYNLTKAEFHLSKSKDKLKTYYHDALTRILYIFMKNHPNISYCQGMNQLAALIFYCFANKNSQYFRRVAQSDAYFCFQIVMNNILKYSPHGFLNGQKYSHRFQELLKKVDLRLFETLQNSNNLNNLKILSIKWFNGLFLSEFQMDESLILWDGFISLTPITILTNIQSEQLITFPDLLMSIALAIVHLNRSSVSQGQNPLILFAKLTNSPQSILQKALNLYQIFRQFFQ